MGRDGDDWWDCDLCWALSEDLRCRFAASRSMKVFPLNKWGGAKRLGVVRSVSQPIHDNPLKASRLPSLCLLSPLVRGNVFKGLLDPTSCPPDSSPVLAFPFPLQEPPIDWQ
jgi:hypothetical protein